MLCFPNAKINIGLNITEKRNDGYHNIESLFYPVGICDALEIVADESRRPGEFSFSNSGTAVDCPTDKNLVVKAYQLLYPIYHLPAVKIFLHKLIPFGGGLGGGSSDAAAALILLNQVFSLDIDFEMLKAYASQLGSDCPFFIQNTPAMVGGRGETLKPAAISLKGLWITIVTPPFGVSTAKAYREIVPSKPQFNIAENIHLPVNEWNDKIVNDFEKPIFNIYPELKSLKEKLFEYGALYASMSGSGSSVYGIFNSCPDVDSQTFSPYFSWTGELL